MSPSQDMVAWIGNKKRWIASILATLTLGGGGTALYGADQAQNPYIDRGAHYELPIQSDIPQGERVEIAKDRAAMTLKGWNDEFAITIEPQIPTAQLGAVGDRPFIKAANRPLLSKRMEYKDASSGVIAFVEPRASTINEFDIDFTLDKKPDTNVFTYKISGAEDFDFFYQPALTPEEIAEGAERPENVTGSYAVYHKSKANHRLGDTNYATGKVAHIFRPKAIDANGVEEWATLDYSNGVLSVVVPQSFLDASVYPVRVDPTFGYTSVGATSVAGAKDTSYAIIYTLSENADVTSMSFYTSSTVSIKPTIYADSSSYPGSREVLGSAYTFSSGIDWETASVSVSLGAGLHWLGWVNGGSYFYYYDTGTTNQRYLRTDSYATPSDPYPAGGTGANRTVSIYATYTASGGGSPAPTQTQNVIWFE